MEFFKYIAYLHFNVMLFAGKSVFDLACQDFVWAFFQIFSKFLFEFCVEYMIRGEVQSACNVTLKMI